MYIQIQCNRCFNPEYECNDLKLLVKNDTVKEKIKDTRSGIKDNESRLKNNFKNSNLIKENHKNISICK